ncbi:hypothetical protein ABZV91_02290 [Nocardia sp. NPDC004568]|uniref:hypothetical protein n=1 Tax=Nocardia sp. NPDC004568 TaxID=3154551 RepID=UPI0033B717FB
MIRKLTVTPAPGGAAAAAERTAATEGGPGAAPADRPAVPEKSMPISVHSPIAPRRAAAVADAGGSRSRAVPREPVCSTPTNRRTAARVATSRSGRAPTCHRPAA